MQQASPKFGVRKTLLSLVVLIAALLAIIAYLVMSSALQPASWQPPQKPLLTGAFAENERLSSTEKIDLAGWYGPEDIAVDAQGNLYAGARKGQMDFNQGSILKINQQGDVTVFANTAHWAAGLHFDNDGDLIACVVNQGLVSINTQGEITVLATEDEYGNPFLIPNDVDIASDGMIYFSNSSSNYPFDMKNVRKIILEAKPDGGLYRYNPLTKKVTTLIKGGYFANGVAVSENDEFVLMVDLAKYRIQRYWLKGDKQGQSDIFIDNLPGIPNGISRSSDGSFWIGFSTRRNDMLDAIQPSPLLKKLIYALPDWVQPQPEAYGMVINISDNGQVRKTYYDTTGNYVPEASSVEEHQGHLYIGGDMIRHIGKYKLEQ